MECDSVASLGSLQERMMKARKAKEQSSTRPESQWQ
jgi:hypothetical protein